MLRRRDQTVRSLRVEHYSSAVNTGRDWWSGLEAIVVLHFIERKNDSIEAGTPGINAE